MKLLVLVLCIAAAFAYPAGDENRVKTAKEYRPALIYDERNLDSVPEKWNFEYLIDDHPTPEEHSRHEVGKILRFDDEGKVQGVSQVGYYTFISPEGLEFRVDYVADENGFQPKGKHLV